MAIVRSFLEAADCKRRKLVGVTSTLDAFVPKTCPTLFRILSRIFPELTGLEADSAVAADGFHKVFCPPNSDPIKGFIRYGAPFLTPNRDLRVFLYEPSAIGHIEDFPGIVLCAEISQKQMKRNASYLPLGWKGGPPYLFCKEAIRYGEPDLYRHLVEFSKQEQGREPLSVWLSNNLGLQVTEPAGNGCPTRLMSPEDVSSPAQDISLR